MQFQILLMVLFVLFPGLAQAGRPPRLDPAQRCLEIAASARDRGLSCQVNTEHRPMTGYSGYQYTIEECDLQCQPSAGYGGGGQSPPQFNQPAPVVHLAPEQIQRVIDLQAAQEVWHDSESLKAQLARAEAEKLKAQLALSQAKAQEAQQRAEAATAAAKPAQPSTSGATAGVWSLGRLNEVFARSCAGRTDLSAADGEGCRKIYAKILELGGK